MDTKILLSLAADVVFLFAYLPYFRDIFAKKTHPHAYTWLIWTITQGIAAIGILYGGGNWGGYYLAAMTLFVAAIFILSLKFGTKNIAIGDTLILILCIVAILIWWQLKQPLFAILLITAIDVFGYIPSIRKSYQEPWSETMISWIMFSIANILGILALSKYNLMTTVYLSTIATCNIILFLVCYFRRKSIKSA